MSLYTPSEITDYSTFLNENHKRINRLLNLFLRFSILIGPVLMLLIRLGVFHSVTYATCIVVSVLLIVLSAFHYVLTRRDGNAVPAAIVAFLAIDLMLILMNSAHIGIYMTWFVVPLISLLFCDFKIYAAAVVINYAMMAVSVWIVSPYYASLRVDFDSAFQYFAGRMGGFSIETVIMAAAGYGLCRISTSHYRDLINTIHSMEEQKKKEARLIHISLTDELTDLRNRRCYDEDIAAYGTREMEDDLVVFSLDVNGLKEMNDTKGHAAGDKPLVDAAKCLASVFEPIGKVYRTGGDEFMAIAFIDEPISVLEKIRNQSEAWEGLSLSTGYASHREYPEKDIHGLEVLADQMMYREKKRYYNTPGHDRRKTNKEFISTGRNM